MPSSARGSCECCCGSDHGCVHVYVVCDVPERCKFQKTYTKHPFYLSISGSHITQLSYDSTHNRKTHPGEIGIRRPGNVKCIIDLFDKRARLSPGVFSL